MRVLAGIDAAAAHRISRNKPSDGLLQHQGQLADAGDPDPRHQVVTGQSCLHIPLDSSDLPGLHLHALRSLPASLDGDVDSSPT